MNDLNIVLSSNERYMPGATVALAGVALNAKPETALHFHVFTEDVKPGTFEFLTATIKRLHPKSEVEQHVCDESILAGLPLWAGSRMAAVRCLYPELLKEVDWCIYLDCDVVYLASPEEHWAFRDDAVYAVVSQEGDRKTRVAQCRWLKDAIGVDIPDEKYFNSGVMLLNLAKMRNELASEKVFDFFAQHSDVPSPDQDALNYVFAGATKMIAQKWNQLQIYLDDAALAKRPVIHYVSGIPWLPKIGVVANGRFRLWHAFADKYVWQKKGESFRRCFTRRMLFVKYLEYWLMMPGLNILLYAALTCIGKGKYYSRWKSVMTDCDISTSSIQSIFGGSSYGGKN